MVDYCSPADKMLCPKSIRRQTRPSTTACLSVSSPKYSNSAMCCWLVGKTMNFPLPSVSSLVVLLVDFLTVDREKRIFVVPAGAECNIIFSRLRLGSIHFPFINLCLGILNNILFHLIYYCVMFFQTFHVCKRISARYTIYSTQTNVSLKIKLKNHYVNFVQVSHCQISKFLF